MLQLKEILTLCIHSQGNFTSSFYCFAPDAVLSTRNKGMPRQSRITCFSRKGRHFWQREESRAINPTNHLKQGPRVCTECERVSLTCEFCLGKTAAAFAGGERTHSEQTPPSSVSLPTPQVHASTIGFRQTSNSSHN